MNDLKKSTEALKIIEKLREHLKEFEHEAPWHKRKFPSFGGHFMHKAILNIERELHYMESLVKTALEKIEKD